MLYLLDNPAWHALTSNNSSLGFGNDRVKFFDAEVSPFAAFADTSPSSLAANFAELKALRNDASPILYMSLYPMDQPEGWKLLAEIPGVQMVHSGLPQADSTVEVRKLGAEHISQMIALAQLTKPGPFATRTIEFGHYEGVFDNEKLVAMTGQRLHAGSYAEVSAVCTHPDYLGRGYARALITRQINRMIADVLTPYLHSRGDNSRAISVYESLGFNTRVPVYFYFLKPGLHTSKASNHKGS